MDKEFYKFSNTDNSADVFKSKILPNCSQRSGSMKRCTDVQLTELGISLFEIAQSLFALERTFILGAMVLLEAKSGAL